MRLAPGLVTPGGAIPWFAGVAGASGPATFNPANLHPDIVLSNANRTATRNAASSTFAGAKGTTPKTTGSWHFEVTVTNYVAGSNAYIGVATEAFSNTVGLTAAGSGALRSDGAVFSNGNAQTASDTFTTGDIIAIEYNATAGSLWLQKLGGTGRKGPFTLPAGAGMVPAIVIGDNGSIMNINAGQSAFAITPTGGFSAWAQ